MLKSMTAFSRKESVSDWGTLVWEMRSVNHRYLDVSIRIADELRLIEPQVREKINARLSRGKVEVSLRFKPSQTVSSQIAVNEALASQVADAAKSLQTMIGDTQPLAALDVLRWPCLLYTSPSPRDGLLSRMPSSA